ncbi:MAG TPA: hypothetical protein VFE47_24935 [Tepidisphaeraceae bacterium]|nr:hypothetical protein [Tepidisphaeraceae bacterium]
MQLSHRTVLCGRALRSFIGAGMLLATALAVIPARILNAAEPASTENTRQVPVPYSFHDSFGMRWNVQADGCIGPDATDVFDAGGRLFVGQNEQYAPNAQTVSYDEARNELIFPAVPLAGLNVSRRISVDAKLGFCRWVEILENTSGAPIKTQVHVNFALGRAVQTTQGVPEDNSQKTLGMAIFDGNHGLAMLGGGRGGAVAPNIVPQQGNDQVDLTWDVEVPAHKTAAIVHLQAVRPNANDAQTFLEKITDRQALHDLPNAVAKAVVNFISHASAFGDLELLRGDLQDIIELRGGDQYKGTIQEKTLSLQTSYGLVTLPVEKVLSMASIGEFHPTQLLITRDGEAFGGALQSPVIHIQLSSGQVTSIPVASIRRFGFRKQVNEPEEFKYEHPMLLLRNGDRIAVEMPTAAIAVATRYGNLQLQPQSIGALVFQAEDQPVHQVLLTDGSRIAALVGTDALELRPLSTGASAAVSFPIAGVSRLQLTQKIDEPGELTPVLLLSTGDRLAGVLGGKLMLETAFDTIAVDGAEVRALHHAGTAPTEVQITLWDDTTLSGRLKGDVIDMALKSGPLLHVPAALIDEYSQPLPLPPPSVLEKLRGLVSDLASDDWKRADRASSELATLGPRITGGLRALRPQQAKPVQERIDAILAKFEHKSDAPTTAPAPPTPPGF